MTYPLHLGNNEWQLSADGAVLGNVHDRKLCDGRPCVIHNPSAHGMIHMRLHWRQASPFDVKPSHFERICEHGVGHPDPDDLRYWESIGEEYMSVHGCDGCCG